MQMYIISLERDRVSLAPGPFLAPCLVPITGVGGGGGIFTLIPH